MRPVLLELEGFGAFRDRTEVDFSGAEQFALVGPTGAGKSTIIDAICFVLYGNVPRYDDHRLIGAAMTMGAAEMRVRLRFDVGDDSYVAVRVVRRAGTGKVATKEARLEQIVDPDDSTAPTITLAGRESEMRDAIDRVVGLSFEDFTRCVVLPQGEFARFLHDKPADRQALLVRLLDFGLYQRLQSRASGSATALDHQIRFIDGQLAELGSSVVDLGLLRAEVVRLAAARQQIEAATVGLESLSRVIDAARSEQARLRRLIDALSSIAMPADLIERGSRGIALQTAVRAAEAECDATATQIAAAQVSADAAGSPDRWDEMVRLHDRRSKGLAVVENRTAAAAAAEVARVAAIGQLAEAEAALDQATAHLAGLERANVAHTLSLDLRPGEPCPVCEQSVGHLPLRMGPAGIEVARQAVGASQAALRGATIAAGDLRVAAATAASGLEQATSLLLEIEGQLAGAPDRDVAMALLDEAKESFAVIETLRRVEQKRRSDLKRARDAEMEFRRGAEAMASAFHSQRDAVALLDPPAPSDDLAASWAGLERWAAAARGGVEADVARVADEAEVARLQMAATLDELSGLVVGSGGPAIGDLNGLRSAVRVAADRAERAVEAEEHRRKRGADLEAERAALADRRLVAAELARLLKADRFQRWLISSTLMELAARASERLRTMSGGQFSLDLSDNGEFAVIDHGAANELRPVRTLSGGETFQASLALALALAEGLGELSGRARRAMDAIFLDEGFGSLDAESLDLVASTIEELSSADGGRMVGIVTHVPALAERMPVRFRVSRDSRSASVVREVS